MYHIDAYLLTLGVTANRTMAWPNGLLHRAMDDLESRLGATLTVMQFMGPWAVSLSPWPLGYGLGPSWMGYDVWTHNDGPSYWTRWIIDVARSQLTFPRVERSLRFLAPTESKPPNMVNYESKKWGITVLVSERVACYPLLKTTPQLMTSQVSWFLFIILFAIFWLSWILYSYGS